MLYSYIVVKGGIVLEAKENVEIDSQLLSKATIVYEKDGYSLNEAIKLFFQKSVDLGKMPFYESESKIRKNTRITSKMCEEVWEQFIKAIVNDSFEFNYISKVVEKNCGMSNGSAFIYLTMLKNLCSGVINTRNMKIEDLKFFLSKIKEDLDDRAVANTITSLKESIEYWKSKIPGNYAEKAQKLLEEFDGISDNFKYNVNDILGDSAE